MGNSNYEKVYVELKDAEGVTHTLAMWRTIDDNSEFYPSTDMVDKWWINMNGLEEEPEIQLAWPETFGAVVVAEHPSAGKKEFINIGGDQWAAVANRGWEDIDPNDQIAAASIWHGIGWKVEEITFRGPGL